MRIGLAFVAVLIAGAAAAMAGSAVGPVEKAGGAVAWNQEASSAALTPEALSEGVPAWQKAQMLWPSADDIKRHGVPATEKDRAEALAWIKKYIRPEYLPSNVADNMVAMKQWGVALDTEKETRRADVFLVRYVCQGLVIQMQESNSNVVLTVAASGPAGTAADPKQFVLDTGTKILKDGLMFGPSDKVFTRADKGTASTITRLSWSPPATVVTDENGSRGVSSLKGGELGTSSISANTNGRFIRFDILKNDGGPSMINPFVKRF